MRTLLKRLKGYFTFCTNAMHSEGDLHSDLRIVRKTTFPWTCVFSWCAAIRDASSNTKDQKLVLLVTVRKSWTISQDLDLVKE